MTFIVTDEGLSRTLRVGAAQVCSLGQERLRAAHTNWAKGEPTGLN